MKDYEVLEIGERAADMVCEGYVKQNGRPPEIASVTARDVIRLAAAVAAVIIVEWERAQHDAEERAPTAAAAQSGHPYRTSSPGPR